MRRFLKQRFRRFLPRAVRRTLRQRFEAKFNSTVQTELRVEEIDSALCCTVDRLWSFLVPAAWKDDLNYLTTTSEGRGEIYNIAAAARQGGVLFDIGAHSGLISALFCAAHPRNRVFSFEPSPVLAERLRDISQLNRFGERMRIERIGIGETTATTEMLLDPVSGFVQAKRFDHTMWESPQTVQIRTERIADAAVRLDIIPQYIKLDIEAYEFEAIKGSLEFLARHKPTIFLELHLDYLEQRGLSAKAVVEMLEECGYELFTCSGSKLKAKTLYDSPLPNVNVVAR